MYMYRWSFHLMTPWFNRCQVHRYLDMSVQPLCPPYLSTYAIPLWELYRYCIDIHHVHYKPGVKCTQILGTTQGSIKCNLPLGACVWNVVELMDHVVHLILTSNRFYIQGAPIQMEIRGNGCKLQEFSKRQRARVFYRNTNYTIHCCY